MSVVYITIYFLCVLAALCAGVTATVSDIRGMTIPNRFCVVIAAAFVPAWLAAHMAGAGVFEGPGLHVLSALIVMGVTAAMFAARALGAGDSKLMAAYGLWAGMAGLLEMVVYTAIAGGILALATIVIARQKPFSSPPERSWIARVQGGERVVPYGIAIFAGALLMFITRGYLMPGQGWTLLGVD